MADTASDRHSAKSESSADTEASATTVDESTDPPPASTDPPPESTNPPPATRPSTRRAASQQRRQARAEQHPSEWSRAKRPSPEQRSSPEQGISESEATQQAKAAGFELLRAPGTRTGFRGVTQSLISHSRPFEARYKRKGHEANLGSFPTAATAALCYASYAHSHGQVKPACEPGASPTQPDVDTPIRPHRGRPMTAAEALRVAASEGLTLRRGQTFASGFCNVVYRPKGNTYEARSSTLYLGRFATAEEAALTVARRSRSGEADAAAMATEAEVDQHEIAIEIARVGGSEGGTEGGSEGAEGGPEGGAEGDAEGGAESSEEGGVEGGAEGSEEGGAKGDEGGGVEGGVEAGTESAEGGTEGDVLMTEEAALRLAASEGLRLAFAPGTVSGHWLTLSRAPRTRHAHAMLHSRAVLHALTNRSHATPLTGERLQVRHVQVGALQTVRRAPICYKGVVSRLGGATAHCLPGPPGADAPVSWAALRSSGRAAGLLGVERLAAVLP